MAVIIAARVPTAIIVESQLVAVFANITSGTSKTRNIKANNAASVVTFAIVEERAPKKSTPYRPNPNGEYRYIQIAKS